MGYLDDFAKSGFEDEEPHDAFCRCKYCMLEAQVRSDAIRREKRIQHPNRIFVDDEIDNSYDDNY